MPRKKAVIVPVPKRRKGRASVETMIKRYKARLARLERRVVLNKVKSDVFELEKELKG
jgi:hypothetical protein